MVLNLLHLLDLLEENPAEAVLMPEVRAPGVFDAWIRRCLALTAANPRASLPHVDTAMAIALTPCHRVQCYGVTAAAYRNLGEVETAAALLAHAWEVSRGCPACEADLLRRRAYVRAAAGYQDSALADVDRAISAHASLQAPDHNLQGHGLADTYLARGNIRQYFGAKSGDANLISGAAEDFAQALQLANPEEHLALYRIALLNMAVPLLHSGTFANLHTANGYLVAAREYWKRRRHEANRELAHLDRLTANVRFQLRRLPGGRAIVKQSPASLRVILKRSRDDFLELGLPVESSAATSDLAMVLYPHRDRIAETVRDALEMIRESWPAIAPEVRQAFHPVGQALHAVRTAALRDVVGVSADEVDAGIRNAIDHLHKMCEEHATEHVMPRLLTWA